MRLPVLAACLGLCLALHPRESPAQEDDYLDAIRQEVMGLGAKQSNEPAGEAVKPPNTEGTEPDDEPMDLSDPRVEFENLVHEEFPGSFFLYKKLAEVQRQKIFVEYQETGDLDKVRRSILEFAMRR